MTDKDKASSYRDDDRDLWIRKRSSYKGQVTIFNSYINGLDTESLSSADITELQLRVGKLELLYDKYDDVQTTLECMFDNSDTQLNERSTFESQYYKLLSAGRQILELSASKNSEADNISIHSNRSATNNNLVKLPTIQLPKFSGYYENWLEFHDTFTSLIHNNGDIDPINKFHYLRASLEGSAAVVIQSIEFSANNYMVAWQVLYDRYNNKRLLIQNHISALFNIEFITRESSVTLKRTIDQINKNLRALESLGEPVKHWDTLLIYIIVNKLDTKTYRAWEEVKGRHDKNLPITLCTFITFLKNRADLIENLELSRYSHTQTHSNANKTNIKIKTLVSAQNKSSVSESSMVIICPACKGDHVLTNCSQFLALNVDARLTALKEFKICYNCFRSGHYANHCKKPGCKVCKRKHNTLIHVADFRSQQHAVRQAAPLDVTPRNTESPSTVRARSIDLPTKNQTDYPVSLSANVPRNVNKESEVLLSTALIKLFDNENKEHIARAILDSGSTSCLMTENMHHKLKLPFSHVDKSVIGINNLSSHINKQCPAVMTSLDGGFSTQLQCFILPSITDHVPSHPVDITGINIPSDICLADPHFYNPADIDIIIGADVFWEILGSKRLVLGKGMPILFETKLGWLVSGPVNTDHVLQPIKPIIRCNFTKTTSLESTGDIQSQLTRFWQLEEVCPKKNHYSLEEKMCEEDFNKNTVRLADGRFCVKIPLKKSPELLGDSYQRAKSCFLSLERRFSNQRELKNMYTEFMFQYESLGHMTEYKPPHDHDLRPNIIPHHGVIRENSTTTKLRAVFNASSVTSSGISFNDLQLVGPTVQDDLLSILIRFRQHRYILAADVEKMYRQVAVSPDHRYLQNIIWRDDPTAPLKVFQLNTVTYGTASAPYLATRCLNQVGLDCSDPKIRDIIIHDMYVDDLLTGGDDIEEVLYVRERVTSELKAACMPLRKFKSNHPQLTTECHQSFVDLNIGSQESSKTLGLNWSVQKDELYFPIQCITCEHNTKREMLSIISQIFDPLGLLSPCVIKMKMLLQKLWLEKLSWDEPLTPEVNKMWSEIIKELPQLNEIRIPRHVLSDANYSVQIHVFTDASERAYGACLYLRCVDRKGNTSVRLLFAKSRVAPIKPTTIPRLELCGALVGSRLYEKAVESLRLTIESVTFWTDSTIVLAWLKMLPSKLQPFVRNRVADILERTDKCTWRHVPTDHNPADLLSRGVDFHEMSTLCSWWNGPQFLHHDESAWPCKQTVPVGNLPEIKPEISLNSVNLNENNNNFIKFERFSNLLRLKRTVAYMFRFINACKRQLSSSKFITERELLDAERCIIRLSQQQSFPEYNLLLQKRQLPPKSPLLKFNVFLDDDGVMRVGGRLGNSNFIYDKKYPMLIQSTNHVTKLLFKLQHKLLMHAGPQLLLSTIRDTYWPIGGRNLARATYRNCVLCTRMKGRIVTPLMGNLPQDRVTVSYPFQTVGVDYAGPIASASRQGRGCKTVKVYIVIFICFSTKAIHLELVGDLTSNNYMLALRRFMSRRGKPSNIYSDNGTSFVGAYNELSKFLKSCCSSVAESAANDGINFHFVPAYSPHFGGLWEAGVKSTKFHLIRVLGNCMLTYEELNSVLVQIESILNSRPLTPLSSHPEDLNPLTPGHFLIGRPLTSLPEQDVQDHSYNYLTRFQRIQQLRQHFWSRWSKEYVSELQQRSKWRSRVEDALKVNTLVVIKEDNLPPLKWKLGRIVAVHPGSDGICRVADIKTATGVVRRSFSKICPLLPVDGCVEDGCVESQAFNARGHVQNQ